MENKISKEELLCELELSLFEQGNYSPEEFLTIINKKIANNYTFAYKYRAYFYSLMAMYDKAIEDYKKALEFHPDDEEIKSVLKNLLSE